MAVFSVVLKDDTRTDEWIWMILKSIHNKKGALTQSDLAQKYALIGLNFRLQFALKIVVLLQSR